jgi:hypothetical protein
MRPVQYPEEGLALRIEAKWTECIAHSDCSALQFAKFRKLSELFTRPSGLQRPICTQ